MAAATQFCTTFNLDATTYHLDCCKRLVTGMPEAAPPAPDWRSAPAWARRYLDCAGHSYPPAVVIVSIRKSNDAFTLSWIRVSARLLAILKNFLNRGAAGRQRSSGDEASQF